MRQVYVRLAALALVLALAAGACGEDGPGAGAPAGETKEATESAVASPSPSPVGLPTAIAYLGQVHSLELPRDEDGLWFPQDLLEGTRTFLFASSKGAANREEASRARNRLAFFDLDSGELDKFRDLDAGLQVYPFDNDGHFLVWVEVDTVDLSHQGWRMYAMDLTTRDMWLVDEDPGIPIERPGHLTRYDPDIAVDAGRLVYWRPVLDSQGTAVYEIRLVHLETRTHTVLLTPGEVVSRSLYNPSLSGDRLVWVETLWGSDGQELSSTMHLTNLSTGETRPLVEGNAGGWPVLQAGKLLYSIGTDTHLMDLDTGQDQVIWESWREAPLPRVLADGLAAWVEPDKDDAIIYDPGTDEAATLSEPFTAGMYANDHIIAWLWRERLPSGDLGDQLFLRWIDLSAGEKDGDGEPES